MNSGLTQLCWAFLATGFCLGAWSLAAPVDAAPNEPEHLNRTRPITRANAAVIVLGAFGWSRSKTLVRNRDLRPAWGAGALAGVVTGVLLVLVGRLTITGPPEYSPLSVRQC